MGSGERVWPRGMGRRIRQVEQTGKAGRECRQVKQAESAGRECRQARARRRGKERRIEKGEQGVEKGEGSMGQGRE